MSEKKTKEVFSKAEKHKVIQAIKLKADQKVGSAGAVDHKELATSEFDNFIGFWLLETIDVWQGFTCVEFFVEDGYAKAKFYDGTQTNVREYLDSDVTTAVDLELYDTQGIPNVDYGLVFDTCDVQVIDSHSLRFNNTFRQELLLEAQLTTSTFKIASYDNDLAFASLYTFWDGSGDSPVLGVIQNGSRFRRLESAPEIQRRSDLTNFWDNPVNIFNYVAQLLGHISQNQRTDAVQCQGFIGNVAFQQLVDTMLTTGVERVNTISGQKRDGGGFVGVWRSQSDDNITTLRLTNQNYFTNVDRVTISGFLGDYAVLNGTHNVSFFVKGTVGPNYPSEFVSEESQIQTVHIDFDSSGIAVPYDPVVHGIATVSSQHGPVTPATEYRDLLIAIMELVTSLGQVTHTNLFAWGSGAGVYETYQDVIDGMQSEDAFYVTVRGRSYGQTQGRDLLYFNPVKNPGTNQWPIFDINDPFGLGPELLQASDGSKWDYDIDVQNYLEVAYKMWFTITGPIDPQNPVTGEFVNLGYTSNGSRVHYVSVLDGETPAPLVDEFGVHEYIPYAGGEFGAYADLFVGGIVKREYTTKCRKTKCRKTRCHCCCKKKQEVVAYIRGNQLGTDFLLPYITNAIPHPDFPNSVYEGNEYAAWATLLERLNEHKPDRFILDTRESDGGNSDSSLASFFGGNRGSVYSNQYLEFGNGEYFKRQVMNADMELVNNSIPPNRASYSTIDTDAIAAVFPKSIVRGSKCKPIHVVVLTNVNAASGGDVFPRNYIGSNTHPPGGIHDLGHHITSEIVGSIDGRIYGPVTAKTVPTSNPNPFLWADGSSQALIPFTVDAGVILSDDNLGTVANQQPWMQPSKLVPSWYEKQWQDIGAIPVKYPYPLTKKHDIPDLSDNTSWRDLSLEMAISSSRRHAKK